jgi:subtilisin family serine protease
MSFTRWSVSAGFAALAALLSLPVPSAVAAPPAAPSAAVLSAGAPGAVKDSYIVVLNAGVADARTISTAAGKLTGRYGGTVRRSYGTAIRGFTASMSAAAARRLAADPAVAYVEQDRVVKLATTQTSPPWGLDRLDQRALPLSGTYGYPGTTSNVTAYILDTGIRISHADFGNRARNGRDFIDNDAVANDCNGHGTHVAGTVGGTKYGVAKEVKLVGVRVLNCSGSGAYSQIIAGIDWVTANAVKPAVATMSLGGTASKSLDDAVRRSVAAGVTYAVAAGNSNIDACTVSPARTPQAITVGATDNTDKRASFSNFGACLDVFAPGVKITSASHSGDTAAATMSGTSMATPHVAGAAALALAANPTATPAQVRDALVAGSTGGKITAAGTGSPNKLLYSAVTVSVPATTPTASPSASPSPTAVPTAAPACMASQTADVKTAGLTYVASSVTVSGCSGRASKASSVYVNLRHPNRGNLVIDLLTPSGGALRLKNFSSDTRDNINTTYSVDASAYNRNGVWKLRVRDMASGSTGYLDSWTVRL